MTIRLICGDCAEQLTQLDNDSVQLIFTSPPYADQRKKTYGGIHPDQYVDWFLPISDELRRVLKPRGTFILNIKEKAVNGERHTYVLDLIKALREQGWLWTEEFIWYKKDPMPGKWPNRFRDAWERLLQFNKAKQFDMYQDAVMVPVSDNTIKQLRGVSKSARVESLNKSGFGINKHNLVGREMVYPTNVVHMATVNGAVWHSAVFPRRLPEWFIKLFTVPDDTVLDPFAGSGTTLFAALEKKRRPIGIEIVPEYVEAMKAKLKHCQPILL